MSSENAGQGNDVTHRSECRPGRLVGWRRSRRSVGGLLGRTISGGGYGIRLVCITASAALAVTLLQVPADAVTSLAEKNTESKNPAYGDVKPDRVSASIAARVLGDRVEDTSQRTPTTTTFANPDGTWTTEGYSGIVRSKTDDDSWVPVDPRLEKRGGGYEPKAAPFEAQFSDGGDRTVGALTTPGEALIEVGWPTKLPAPEVAGAQLTYPGAAGEADLVVASQPAGFSYSVVLDKAPAMDEPQLEYRFPLKFDGAEPTVKSDGSIIIKDGKNRIAVMTPPVMWDGANASEDGERHRVDATVTGEGDQRTLILRPDMDFLRDPETVYPVTVDPTLALTVAGDTWVQSFLATSSNYTSPELQVGSTSWGINVARSYLYFDFAALATMPSMLVSSAQVELSNFETGACAGTALRMSRITGAWTIPGITWGTQPATTTAGASTSTGSYGATGCTAEGTVSFDATQIFTDWANGAWNVGVQIKADNESANTGWRKFRSLENGDLAKAPKFTVTYNSYPSRPTGTTVTPGNTYGATAYSTSLTPTLSTVVSDPDGGAVRGFFEVYNSAGTTVLWSGSSAWATSGAQVSTTVPSGVLTNGTAYHVAAYSQDSALKSQSAQLKAFTVDTSAPATTITATGYANNTWTSPAPSSNTFTFDGPADTAMFEGVLDGVPGTYYANSSGDFSFPYVYVAEWHSFQVTAVDKAGNRGATSTFSFGSAAPGFTTPRENSPSTSVFPLEISAPPNATGAVLSWKMEGETTWRAMGTGTVTKAGSAWGGAVSTSGGRTISGQLLWTALDEQLSPGVELDAPAVLNLRACFQYVSGGDKCTYVRTLQLVPSAFGGSFPTADLGPATVALFTGEARISGMDAADSKAGLGRTFSSFDAATFNAGLFGPGWSDPKFLTAPGADTHASVIDTRAKDNGFVILDAFGGSQTFVSNGGSSTSFIPLEPTGDVTSLTFTTGTGGDPDSLALVRPLGTGTVITTWLLQTDGNGMNPEWVFGSINAPGTNGDLAAHFENQRPTFIRESDPSASSTCNHTTQTVGCRGLAISYTGSGSATRVASVSRVVGAATPSAVQEKTLATYTYTSGVLDSVCSAVPAIGKPALCTSYVYTTVAGRTLLSEVTPSGLKKWRLSYDSNGRLTTVKRERPTGGDSTWSIDYTLTPTSSGLPDVSAGAAGQWGQQIVPTKVFAVYQPFNGPAGVDKADLFYTTDNGTTTNSASYSPNGWLVATSWYDARGNEVKHLDPTGWARVQAASVGDRPAVAAEASSYTVFNDWGNPEIDGTLVVDEYGPAHTATLKDGTTGRFRTHTHTMYDGDPAVDPSLVATKPPGAGDLGLAVKTTTSASDTTRTTDFDKVHTTYGYDAVVTGDGSGWTLGVPTTVSTQVDSSTWSTQTTRFDIDGRAIESRQPGGSTDGTGAGNDARSTITTYYTASGSGDCGGKPAWDGLICKVSPAAQPAGTTMPITYNSDFNEDLQSTSVQEISGGTVARTTTTTYDNLGRVIGITKATGGSGVTNDTIETTYGYGDNTGLPTTATTGSDTITSGYDSWGRATSYADALATSSTTTYDAAGNLASFNDGAATYTYTYDGHNILTGFDAGGGVGTFSYSLNAAGNLGTVTYPNGVVASHTYDQVGNQTGLRYSQGSVELVAFTGTVDADGRTVARTSSASVQEFEFDYLGRLTRTRDDRAQGCTTRSYGFDASSNRSSFASYDPGPSGECQTNTAADSRTNGHDEAGRITNAGYAYDRLGRTLTTPQVDAGHSAAGPLTSTFRANDMLAVLSQSVGNPAGGVDAMAMTYGLDPVGRFQTITSTKNGSESQRLRYRYSNDSDSPSRIDSSVDAGLTWTSTRYVIAPGLGAVGSNTGGTTTLHLADLHGDLVATISGTSGASMLGTYSETDEYGNPDPASSRSRYGWLGTHQRSADALGGISLMGVRAYNPTTGNFLSVDPIRGGTPTAYAYPQDPINLADTTGAYTYWWGGFKHYSTSWWKPYTYVRIWINIDGLRKVKKASDWLVALIGLRLGLARVAQGALAFAVYAVLSLAADIGLDWLNRHQYGVAYKLYLSKRPKVPIGGYPYLSHYAWSKGR